MCVVSVVYIRMYVHEHIRIFISSSAEPGQSGQSHPQISDQIGRVDLDSDGVCSKLCSRNKDTI